MKSIILDVDTGIDDALAIAYAVRSPELRMLGVTTCFGNVSLEEATRNSLFVLEKLGRQDVRVYAGESKPLFRPGGKGYARHVHGEDGLGGTLGTALPNGKAEAQHAAAFMVEQVRKMPGEVTIVAVGRMVNLALAVMMDPEFVRLVGKVVIMGGAVTVPGNVTSQAEANIYGDPEAAAYVFRSGLPITLVGLDVTMRTLLPRERLQEWRDKNCELTHMLADATDFYMNSYETRYPGFGGCPLHDPLAVGMVVDPSFCRMETMHVEVDVDGLFTTGRTVAGRMPVMEKSPNMNVCLDVDAERFLEHFMSRMVQG